MMRGIGFSVSTVVRSYPRSAISRFLKTNNSATNNALGKRSRLLCNLTFGCRSFRSATPLQNSLLPVIAWTWPSHSRVKAVTPKLHGGAHFILSFAILGQQANRIDLSTAVSLVLRGVQSVRFRGAGREAVVLRQFTIDFFGDLPRASELAFDEGEHGHSFQRRTSLAAADNHLNRRQGSRRRLGIVRFLPRDAAFFEKLQHDIHVRAFTAELFHEIFQNSVHHRILFGGDSVDRHIAKEDRIGPDPQIVLDFTENNLLLRSNDA